MRAAGLTCGGKWCKFKDTANAETMYMRGETMDAGSTGTVGRERVKARAWPDV